MYVNVHTVKMPQTLPWKSQLNRRLLCCASDLWLAESGYRLISVNTETADNAIYIVLLGEGELPPLSVLKDKLDGKTFGKTVKVETVQSALKYLHLEED